MIADAPYGGGGYLGTIANAAGSTGFEASFPFGGGGGFAFRPLTGKGAYLAQNFYPGDLRLDRVVQTSGPRRTADVDHVAVTVRGIFLDKARDQDAPVERDDLTILIGAGRSGRTDIVLAAR